VAEKEQRWKKEASCYHMHATARSIENKYINKAIPQSNKQESAFILFFPLAQLI
jgi:hypothetical protein